MPGCTDHLQYATSLHVGCVHPFEDFCGNVVFKSAGGDWEALDYVRMRDACRLKRNGSADSSRVQLST